MTWLDPFCVKIVADHEEPTFELTANCTFHSRYREVTIPAGFTAQVPSWLGLRSRILLAYMLSSGINRDEANQIFLQSLKSSNLSNADSIPLYTAELNRTIAEQFAKRKRDD